MAKGQTRTVRKVAPKHRAVKRKSVVIPPAKEGQGRDARKAARREPKRAEYAAARAEEARLAEEVEQAELASYESALQAERQDIERVGE